MLKTPHFPDSLPYKTYPPRGYEMLQLEFIYRECDCCEITSYQLQVSATGLGRFQRAGLNNNEVMNSNYVAAAKTNEQQIAINANYNPMLEIHEFDVVFANKKIAVGWHQGREHYSKDETINQF
ncbi:hypothetical protein WA026_018030 [Henosepilachna vigintioctopunctata]|uniref:Uncharacterized protein n=1 Tax=Henosepilachna vigintioctopunctata TaxID=420089 RepID=A0AAW1UGN8_9CUCU